MSKIPIACGSWQYHFATPQSAWLPTESFALQKFIGEQSSAWNVFSTQIGPLLASKLDGHFGNELNTSRSTTIPSIIKGHPALPGLSLGQDFSGCRRPRRPGSLSPVLKVIADALVFVHGFREKWASMSDRNQESQDGSKEFENPGRRGRRRSAEAWSGPTFLPWWLMLIPTARMKFSFSTQTVSILKKIAK